MYARSHLGSRKLKLLLPVPSSTTTSRTTTRSMASQHIVPMEWGDASVQGVLNNWWSQALRSDSPFIQAYACTDVHDYLTKKVHYVVATRRSPGQSGYSFYYNGGPDQCLPCLIWADGTHNQETPLGPPQPGEQWWPCICLNVNPDANGLLPFYCPALAWGNSRPWMAHVSRVRRLVGRPPQQAPPSTSTTTTASSSTNSTAPEQAPPQQQSPQQSTASPPSTTSSSESSDWQVIDLREMD